MHPLLKKLNYREGTRVHVMGAPEEFQGQLGEFRESVEVVEGPGEGVAFLLGFAKTLAEVEELARAARATEGDAVLWIAYPKGSSKRHKCEFNRDTGWEAMGRAGFEPVRQVALDEDWSALRFRRVEHIQKMTRSFAMTDEGKAKAARSKQGLP